MAPGSDRMKPRPPPTAAAPPSEVLLAAALLVVAGLLAYANSFQGPFVQDDAGSILNNPSLTRWWDLPVVLSPTVSESTVAARPLVNFTLALNYAAGGFSVSGYHAVNLLIHLLAGLTLFGLARRTFLRPVLRERFGSAATPLALAIALLWLVHPLQTEAVTYVVQRAEALAGLFCLAALYGLVRSMDSPHPRRWLGFSVVACLLGMASKEVMVSAPLLAFFYDRTFVAGSFREAWRQRGRYYAGLAATWLLLAWLVAAGGTRGDTAGFGLGVSPWAYAQAQFVAVAHYLMLAFWPHPLVFDYGEGLPTGLVAVGPSALVVIALIAATVVALWRWPMAGFLGLAFFALLAPSSSVVPVLTEPMAEHRMYLPLAAVLALVLPWLYVKFQRRALYGAFAVALLFGVLTILRNGDYSSEASLWADTVEKRPDNARAHATYGVALMDAEDLPAALRHLQRALELKPDFAVALYNYGNAQAFSGEYLKAVENYRAALRLQPDLFDAYNNLGTAYLRLDRVSEAVAEYRAALRLNPKSANAHFNLGNALSKLNQLPEARTEYERALEFNPSHMAAHFNLGNTLLALGNPAGAIAQYEIVEKLDPTYEPVHDVMDQARRALSQTSVVPKP